MRKQLLWSGRSLVGMVILSGLAACSNKKSPSSTDAGSQQPDTGPSCTASAPDPSYVLIDDMETTTHGPIEFTTGIDSPLTPGYWYNSGANYFADGGAGSDDTSTPPQGSFVFTALSAPTTTLNCKASAHAAHQACALNGLYDTCGIGFEFAQQPDVDGGTISPDDAAASDDAGDGGPSIPRTTIPFDISHYKAMTFWGMTTTPDPDTDTLQVKVQFPDTDTDPRGEVCNGAGPNTSKCYNSYAAFFDFTTSWQQFTVVLDAGQDGGAPAAGGIKIDPSWGYQRAQWLPTQVYGVNWQVQRNTDPSSGPPLMTDIWIDDVYFIQ
jgi:hypothetical protein